MARTSDARPLWGRSRRPTPGRRRGPRARAAAVLVALAATLGSAGGGGPAGAAGDPAAEREQVRAQRAAVAAQIDALQATEEEVSAALDAVDAHVRTQEALVADARRALAASEATVALAGAEVQRAGQALEDLARAERDLAVAAYVLPPARGVFDYIGAGDPAEARARRALAELQSRRLLDATDALHAAEEDVAAWRGRAEEARAESARREQEVAEQLARLEAARAQQQALADEVQERIDRALSESAALADLDQKLSEEIARQQAALAARLAGRGRSGPAGPVATPAEIVNAAGIYVHRSIAAQVEALVAAAAADGLALSGGGWRDTNRQIALRRQNCGGSDYAVYQMPSGSCRPPTASPERSMHERGLAIDFRCNGGGIGTRASPCYRWLAANAARYGLRNLPSEPWHWSTTGS